LGQSEHMSSSKVVSVHTIDRYLEITMYVLNQ